MSTENGGGEPRPHEPLPLGGHPQEKWNANPIKTFYGLTKVARAQKWHGGSKVDTDGKNTKRPLIRW